MFALWFPAGRDSATFWDKGTEVSSLSRDKGTTGQTQTLAKGRAGPGQPVKVLDRTWDGTVRDFDSLSRPVPLPVLSLPVLRPFLSCPIPWQDFELVPLSLCPGTMKKLLSLCPEKLLCPVPLETLVGNLEQI